MSPSKPKRSSTFGRYIADIIFGANDGLVTTFAVVAGAAGAGLTTFTVVALGLANLVGDGISMGLGEYLGRKSELQFFRGKRVRVDADAVPPVRRGFVMFLAFVAAGLLPVAAFMAFPGSPFAVATAASACAMFAIGALRSSVLPVSWWRAGLEMLLVGGLASGASYGIGLAIAALAHA